MKRAPTFITMQTPVDKNHPLAIPGVALIAQRRTPAADVHEFTLAPHNERTTLKALLTRLGPRSQLVFHDPAAADPADPESSGEFVVARSGLAYQTRRGAASCFSEWVAIDVNELLGQLLTLAPSNRGRLPRDRARLTIPSSKPA